MTGKVSEFACGRPHPQLGDTALCTRQRFHAGDHRATAGNPDRLLSWADAPLEPAGRGYGKVAGPAGGWTYPTNGDIPDVSDGADLPDHWTATELEATGGTVRDPLWLAALLVLVAVLLAAPAALVILYGQAF